MRTKDVDMLSGSIVKGLLALCVPVMIMNVLQAMFNIIDMTILKSFDSDGMAVGAVGVCGTLITMITNLLTGTSAGFNVIVARYIGKKDPEHTKRAIGASFAFSIVSGLALGAVGIIFAEQFLNFVNCPEALFSRALLYFRLYFAGAPLLMITTFCASILRACGKSNRVMTISITNGVVKVITTYLLVAVFRMGITGVALATLLAWVVYAVMGLASLLRNQSAAKLYWNSVRFYRPELPQILRIGVPTGVQMFLYSTANVIIVSAVNSFGPQAATGVSIANNFDNILYQICHATSLAVMPYVSQNIGAGNVKRATRCVLEGILLTAGIGIVFGSLSAIFSSQLSSIMSDDPVVIDYSRQKMIIISSTYFICGIMEILNAALRAMGKPTFPTVTTLIFMCGLRFIWVYFVFPLQPNLTFLYLVWPIGWIASIICALAVYFPTKRKLAAAHQPLSE